MAATFYLWFALRLSMGSVQKPGSGLFPTLIGVALVAITLYISICATIRPIEAESPFREKGTLLRPLIVLGMMSIYVAALSTIGHLLACGLFFAICAYATGPGSWGRAIIGGVIAAVTTAVIFHTLLEVPLPLFPSFKN